MTSPLTGIRFAVHLLRRLPAALREGRVPHRPREVFQHLRASLRGFAQRARAGGRTGPSLPRRRAGRPGTAHLLFVSHNLNLEGAAIFLFNLARSLDRARYDVHVLSPSDGPLRERYEADGIPIEVVAPFLPRRRVTASAGDAPPFVRWARDSGVDLVVCNTLMAFWGVGLARLAGLPSVWCIHESVDWRTYFDCLTPALAEDARRCLHAASRLVFVADGTRRLFGELEQGQRLQTIRCGLDAGAIEAFKRAQPKPAVRAAHGVADGERVISIVGTTCERKGQLDFLRVARLLEERRREALRFYVVGAREGKYLRELRRFARRHALDSVTFVEETPRVYDYYRLSDLFVCTSYVESLPLVILEAMAFELPIVSTDVFGIPEAIRDDWSGLLAPPGDAEALASRVARILDDPGLGQRLARNAHATFTARFTRERMTEQYDRLFQECLGRAMSPASTR